MSNTTMSMSGQRLIETTSYEKVIEYGVSKSKNSTLKTLILAFMGGMFICIGNFAFQIIMAQEIKIDYSSDIAKILLPSSSLNLFLASSVFSIGLLFCEFVGGSIFTSSCMMALAVMNKKVTLKQFGKELVLVAIGNTLGATFFAALMLGSGIYTSIGKFDPVEISTVI
jgi:formate/nitrite transporter FocA (FNT family)